MAASDIPVPVAPPPAPPRAAKVGRRGLFARRWFWLSLAGAVLLVGGIAALEGWAAWEERSARKAVAEEHFDEAQQHIDRALSVRGQWVSTNLLAARIARLRGAYSESEQYLSHCGQGREMTEEVQLEWLLLRFQRNGDDALAPNLFALVQDKHSESPAILEALAGLYMRHTRYLEALRCLNRWLELTPDCVRALDWRGWVSNQLDHRGQAVSDYERALELQPGRSVVRLRLAEVLVESAQCREAVPHLERLRNEQPGKPEVLVALARCRMVQLRKDEARTLLDSVLATQPDHFDALLYRGKLEMQSGNYAEAERWLRRALERSPRDPEARYSLYQSLQSQENREGDAEVELARWEQYRQNRDRLTRLLRTELDRKPNDPDLAAEAGDLFLQQGEDQRGLYWLHRALSLNPRHASSHRALIAYYERTNNPAKAAEHRQQLTPLDSEK